MKFQKTKSTNILCVQVSKQTKVDVDTPKISQEYFHIGVLCPLVGVTKSLLSIDLDNQLLIKLFSFINMHVSNQWYLLISECTYMIYYVFMYSCHLLLQCSLSKMLELRKDPEYLH